jgi:NADPH:quinone reductase-like Zn-dependent oxidoreductase
MQAIVQDEYGDVPEEVLQLDEVLVPTRGEGEVLVRVHARASTAGLQRTPTTSTRSAS